MWSVASRSSLPSGLADQLGLHVGDGLADSGQLFGVFVGNFRPELFLESHDQFDLIQGISPEILDEFGFGIQLLGVDAKLLNDDLFNAFGR
mgnify:CR=1 FL=1